MAPVPLMTPTVVLGLTSPELKIDMKIQLPVGKDRMPFKQVLSGLASVGLSGKGFDKTVDSDLNRWEQEVQKRENLYREQHEFYSQVESHFAEMSETVQRMKRDYYREIDHLREQISKGFRDPDNVIFFDPDLYKLPSWEKIVEMLDGCRMKREVLETEYLEHNMCDRVKQVPINMLCSGCRNKFQTPKEAAAAYREEMRHEEMQVNTGELGWELVRLSARPAPVVLAPREEPQPPPAPTQPQPFVSSAFPPALATTVGPVQEDTGDYGFRVAHRPRAGTGGSSFGAAASQPDERPVGPASDGSGLFAADGPAGTAPGPARLGPPSRAATPATASTSSAGAAAPRRAGQEASQDPLERRRGAEPPADGATPERGVADGAAASKASSKGAKGKHGRASRGHASGDAADDAPGSHPGAAGSAKSAGGPPGASGAQPGAAERRGHAAGSGGLGGGADGGLAGAGAGSGAGGGAGAAGGGDAGAEACAGGSSSSTARPKRARGHGASGGDEDGESDAEDGEASAKPSKKRLTAEELEERGTAMASKLEEIFSEDPATRALKLLKQRARTQKEQAASCLGRQMEAMKRHAARMAMARWRGATIVCKPVFQLADDPAEDPHNTHPVQGLWEANSWGQRPEPLGPSSGPARPNTVDSFQQHQQVTQRSRSLVASQPSRHIPDLQAECAQRPNSSCGVVWPQGAGRFNPVPLFCDARDGLLGGSAGGLGGVNAGSRAYLGRHGLLGRGHIPSSRMPWECPTTLQGVNPKLAQSYFEGHLDQHDQPRAVAIPSASSLSALDQVKSWHWSTIRLARDKRLPPAGSSSSLMVTGERPGTSGGVSSAGLMHSAPAGPLGLRIHGKQAPKNAQLPPQGCAA